MISPWLLYAHILNNSTVLNNVYDKVKFMIGWIVKIKMYKNLNFA